MRMSRNGKNAVTGSSGGESGGFMQIIDAILGNITDGVNVNQLPEFLSADSSEEDTSGDASGDASVFSMLSELLQSGNNPLTQNIVQFLQENVGIEGIDEVKIPNMIAELQENNFFEAMGMDEEASDTLYALGNNTYDYFNNQFNTVKDYISGVAQSDEATTVDTQTQQSDIPVTETQPVIENVTVSTGESQPTTVETVPTETIAEVSTLPEADSEIVTGTMQTRETVKSSNVTKINVEGNEIPITSFSYEKIADNQAIQPPIGITVPSMVSQRIIKADTDTLEQLKGGGEGAKISETDSFDSQLSEMVTANANVNIQATQPELPKVQNMSNPLFKQFQISEQITDGIKANLNLEKTEFTVKLNPESLGELTLKLVEEGGKMVLDITAASENTARLLNSDLAVLRESVGSMNLEIREVSVAAPENIDANNAQFNMTGQQFSEQHRAFANHQQQSDKPYYASQHSTRGIEEVAQDYSSRVTMAVDGLDTYV